MRLKFISLFLLLLIVIVACSTLSTSIVDAAGKPPPADAGGNEPCPLNKCDTAIGYIDVSNPVVFITKIFSITLAVGAIGATILIIYAGYKILTSRGNKEAIQAARETITSAVVGLLFIVFSLVILSIVAGDILKIPGFG